jgi:serine/threonine protein kinase
LAFDFNTTFYNFIYFPVLGTTDCTANEEKFYTGYVRLLTNFSNQQMKTKPSEKSKSPAFDQEFTFLLATKDVKKTDAPCIIIRVMKKQKWPHQDQILGETSVFVDEGKDLDSWLPLETPKKKNNGKIHVVVSFAHPSGSSKEKEKESAAEKFAALYKKGSELGKGAFSVVYNGTRTSDGVKVAIKCVDKTGQSADVIKLLKREISVMQKLQHPGIISLLDVFETDEMITMVLELVNGGELYDQIISRGSFTEQDASGIAFKLLGALDYMHQNGVAHRDLKPENLLCENGVDVIKIADFGLSKDFSMASVMQTCCGSPSYVAPEVLAGGTYDTACDIWSLGVISYVLLSGYLPFFADTQPELFEKIMEGKFAFAQPLWTDISDEAKNFVTECLTLEPASRPTAAALLKHKWIADRAKGRTKKLETVASMADLRSGFNPKTRGKE